MPLRFQIIEASFVVLSIVVLSLAVCVGKIDVVDIVGIEIPETMLEDELDEELDGEIALIVIDEGALSLEEAELIEWWCLVPPTPPGHFKISIDSLRQNAQAIRQFGGLKPAWCSRNMSSAHVPWT